MAFSMDCMRPYSRLSSGAPEGIVAIFLAGEGKKEWRQREVSNDKF